MNLQEIFTKVVTHLRNQNVKSGDLTCWYRSHDDRMCAVGCVIEDEFYSFRLEGLDIGAGIVKYALADSGIDIYNKEIFEMLGKLQKIHDLVAIEGWEYEFMKIGKIYGLEIEPNTKG